MQTMLLPNLTQEKIELDYYAPRGPAIAVEPNPWNQMQEGMELKPGYVLNPLFPLWSSGIDPEGDLAQQIYNMAYKVENFGTDIDFKENLEELIEDMNDGIFGWYKVAATAWKIKFTEAWKGSFRSFRDFCQKALGVTAASIDSKIRAARVLSQLIAMGFDRLPRSHSVANELSKLHVDSLEDTWRDICDRFQDHEITLEKVKTLLYDPLGKIPQFKKVGIPIDKWDRLKELARQGNISPSRLIEGILDQYIGESTHDDGISTGAEDPETSEIAGLGTGFEAGKIQPQDSLPDQTDPEIIDSDSGDEKPTEAQNLLQHPERPSDQVLVSNETRSQNVPPPNPMFAIGQILPTLWRPK